MTLSAITTRHSQSILEYSNPSLHHFFPFLFPSVEHVIVFMQENRAYDHYYGMHQGVRGFNDRAAIQLRSGFNSLVQPTNQNDLSEYMLPFHTNSMTTSAMCMSAPAMAYPSDMLILNGGRLDSWNTGRAPGMVSLFF